MKSLNNILIYLFSSLFEKGMAFLLIPLYTHYLTPQDYGILTIVQSIIAISIIFFTLSLNGAASRYHFDGKRLYRKLHYGNIFSLVTILSVFCGILFIVFSSYIFKLAGNISLNSYVYLVLIIVYGTAIYNIYQLKLQMEQRAVEYGVNNIIKFLISTIVTIYLIIYINKKADGVLEGQAVAFIVFIVFIGYKLKKERLKFNLNKKLLRRNLKYSINLVPHNIAGIMMQFLDKFFILKMINLSQVGIYSLGGQVSMSLSIIAGSINTALVPVTLKAFKEKNYILLRDIANITVMVLALLAMTLSIFSNEIINLISPKSYSEASTVISTLSFYFVVQMYYFRTVGVLFYEEKATKFVPVATGLSLIFNFVFNLILIKYWGIVGAGIATLLSIVLVNYIVIFIANKYIKVGFDHLRMHFYIIVGFIIGNLSFPTLVLKLVLVLLISILYLYTERKNSLVVKIRKHR